MLNTGGGLGATLLLVIAVSAMPDDGQARRAAAGGTVAAAAGGQPAQVRINAARRPQARQHAGPRSPAERAGTGRSVGHKAEHHVGGRRFWVVARHRLPPAAQFRGGPNGAVANRVLIRPGSPGRAAGCDACARADAGFIAWYGPVFWPYAFDDIFTFAFWPSDYAGYDGPFWARAYSDTVDGVFKADGNADVETPAAEVRAEHGWRWHGAIGRSRAGVRGLTGQSREFARICGRRAPDLTDWPIERITRTVQSRGVRQQLAELAAAATAGAAMLHAACRIELPTSPIDRIEGEQLRLDAASRALAVVRPQVGAFWARLSDDQKARFDSRQDGPAAAAQGSDPSSALDRTGWASAAVCADSRSPADQQALAWIDDVVQPTGTQRGLLADLRDANARATQLLQSSCPTVMPRTPPERLDVLARRLAVMLDAVGLERRALQRFYASLTKAQQARLNGTGCDGTCP